PDPAVVAERRSGGHRDLAGAGNGGSRLPVAANRRAFGLETNAGRADCGERGGRGDDGSATRLDRGGTRCRGSALRRLTRCLRAVRLSGRRPRAVRPCPARVNPARAASDGGREWVLLTDAEERSTLAACRGLAGCGHSDAAVSYG